MIPQSLFGDLEFIDPMGMLSKIRISTLPLNGQLKLNGLALQVNQEILSAHTPNLNHIPLVYFNGNRQV